MSHFSPQRFAIALRNDVLAQAKLVGISTLALFVLGLLMHLSNVRDQSKNPGFFAIVFVVALVPVGFLFASLSWNDMHHPLGRFHYLMLPYSNLERFVSRYLLTAPLYWLYTVLAINVFIMVANLLSDALFGLTSPGLALDSSTVVFSSCLFFGLHPLVFAGAIRFRNFALPRTVLFVFLLVIALGLIVTVTQHVVYFDYCEALFRCHAPPRMSLFEMLTPETGERVLAVLGTLISLWALYMAWLMLNDHEVQDGL